MGELSKQLLYQRLRNRVIEMCEIAGSLETVAGFGAFGTINEADGWLPLDYDQAPLVFDGAEREVLDRFVAAMDAASDATDDDVFDLVVLENMPEWRLVRERALAALDVFSARGRFPEDHEVSFDEEV